jgi:hypothetical protein
MWTPRKVAGIFLFKVALYIMGGRGYNKDRGRSPAPAKLLASVLSCEPVCLSWGRGGLWEGSVRRCRFGV